MEEGFSQRSVPIILGRPFMKTTRSKIDVYAGTLSMEFGDITVYFNILDAMKHPPEDLSVFHAKIIDHIVDEYMTDLHSNLHACHSSCIESEFVLDHMSEFDVESESKFDIDYTSSGVLPLEIDFLESDRTNHVLGSTYTSDFLYEVQDEKPSLSTTIQPPPPELKPLPSNLKYAYLDDSKSFPVIIFASLVDEQEEKLLSVLNKQKQAIGWTLADIPGISPSTCMHRINLEDGDKPIR